ncbi:MAG: acyl-CoA thioesterase [Deferribacterota bacterium]|nr:acyl-CoA thioesterase [Deferribacterota bacterium]
MEIYKRPSGLSREKILPLNSNNKLREQYKIIEGNILGNFRFGLLLEELDILAGETANLYVAQFYNNARIVTAAIDQILLRDVFRIDEDIILKSRVNYVGTTSMEIGIRIEQIINNKNIHIATCYFTMVARLGNIDNDYGAKLPPLEYVEDLDKVRAQNAIKRKKRYLKEQKNTATSLDPKEFENLFSLYYKSKKEDGNIFIGDTIIESWERTYPEHKNPNQTIFGGYLARKAYELSSICSDTASTNRSLIGAVNRINFFYPVLIGDKLKYTSKIVDTTGPYISIESNIYKIPRGEKNISALTNSCFFTFINVDDKLKPIDAIKVYPYTLEDCIKTTIAKRNLKLIMEESSPLLIKDLC